MKGTSRTRSGARRRRAAAAVAAALALTAAACSGKDHDGRFLGSQEIDVAMHKDLPGMSLFENYTYSGFDNALYLDLEKWLEGEEGVQVTRNADVSSAARIAKLQSGDADLVVASFSITPDRMKEVDFVGPYLTTVQGFLVRSGSGIREHADLSGKRICTWDGTTSRVALGELRNSVSVGGTDAEQCVRKLRQGRVDAVSTDQVLLYGFAQHSDDAEGLEVVPDLTVGAPQHYGIGVAKGHREDCRRLADWLKDYVGGREWQGNFREALPLLTAEQPDWISRHKPEDELIDAHSCVDRPKT
ncbi:MULTISPECIES: transporter substrate-binding domain-containing protein [Streptomyces]|uniref:Glutamate transport system substrate-binding protein n=1 Tax=Streptomyces calvus TaxID=67282 RepID=A0A514JWY1_9ACTN|nr:MULTISPECIES: transporter substrate-binding domain-containing protein [Streptomyces]MBA8946764.1 glutamate transport system substrate-binding protein [Streptomyces calvus]MBA8973542.1 glutamate transport system substrate-binding protein [Streptomyces calvus]MYS29919.1 transporter substrate-binding domain-containing protein [Streptomyces sp. SID7804]QDI71907.1 glutamate-binding protein [Streptomyces calvus]